MSTRILTPFFALALATGYASTDPAAEASAQKPAATVVGAAAATGGTANRSAETLSVDFPQEEIRTILRNVAELFDLNLVVPDTLTGSTSIKLRDVTWRQIFSVVLSPVGYSYIEEGNIIKVVSNDTLTAEPTTTDVIIVNNAKATDLVPVVNGLVDAAAGGKIIVNERSNALVITERPSRMGRIRETITKLDRATDQVMIESKFVEVTDSDIRNIGVNWASLQGMRLGVSGITQTWGKSATQSTNNENNGGIETNNKNNLKYIVDPIADQQTPGSPTNSLPNGTFGANQTTVPSNNVTSLPANGNVAVLPNTYPSHIGVADYNIDPNSGLISYTPLIGADNLTTGTGKVLSELANTGSQGRLASAVFSASDFNVIISALKSQSNTKVVSNPTIVTLNNTEAMLNIGQEFPIPSYTYNTERGAFEVSGFQYKPIGIILKVTPQVNAQGIIRLNLEPEVSQTNGTTTFGGAGGASIPIIATRKVKTQISLKDGYTAGIGGLIQQQKDHGGTKVPVLGDIPLIGKAFRSQSVNDVDTNLLVFITAKTVKPDGATPEAVFQQSALEAVGMGKIAEAIKNGTLTIDEDGNPKKSSSSDKKGFFRLTRDGSDLFTPAK